MPASTEIAQIEKFFSSFQRRTIANNSLTLSAVLVLLTGTDNELSVLFTKRTDTVEHHKGQISFPGGSRAATDHDIVDTALRETEEEIGLSQTAVRILGIADDFETPSGFCITPIVGYVQNLPLLHRNKDEVVEIFTVPISFFFDSKNERIEQHHRFGTIANIYFYQYQKYTIWGATAAILRSVLQSVRENSGFHSITKTL